MAVLGKIFTFRNNFLACIIASVTLFLLPLNAYSEDAKIAVVTEILEPYQFLDQNQNVRGYGIDVLNALMKQVEFSPEIEVSPWPRAYNKALHNKNTMILSIARTPERENLFHWIGQLNQETFSFYALKSNKNIRPINNLEDLKNYSVIVTKNSVLDEIARKYQLSKLERAADIAQSFTLLYRQRADLFFISDSTIKQQTAGLGYNYNDLVKVFQFEEFQSDFYIAINRDSDSELVKRLKTEFQWLQENNVIQQLKAKWKF